MPRLAWEKILWRTILVTLFSVLVSLVISEILLSTFSGGMNGTGAATAILIPIVLGAPMIFYLSLKNFELEQAYKRLEASAARDSLTQCLNHGAFVARTSEILKRTSRQRGALLVIDADHFKSINDRFGHETGDMALKQIATIIRASVRRGDLVGRMGGEEFGVFLPDASATLAHAIAEAIRVNIEHFHFTPNGTHCPLTVSIGGITFDMPMSFGDLFRLADERLYKVKNTGRNSIEMAPIDDTVSDQRNLAHAV